MSQNAKALFTKQCILDALCLLVNSGTKNYSAITVTDIVNKAGVCRNSFYRYFTSIDDVFFFGLAQYTRNVNNELEAIEKQQNVSIIKDLQITLQHFKENKNFYLAFEKANAGLLIEKIESHIFNVHLKKDASVVQKYQLYALVGSFYTLAMKWIKDENPLPLNEIIKILVSNKFLIENKDSWRGKPATASDSE